MKIDGAKASYLALNYDERALFRKRVNQDSIFWRVPVPEEDEEEEEEAQMIRCFMQKLPLLANIL